MRSIPMLKSAEGIFFFGGQFQVIIGAGGDTSLRGKVIVHDAINRDRVH
jgi:phosphotransferase system IIB component